MTNNPSIRLVDFCDQKMFWAPPTRNHIKTIDLLRPWPLLKHGKLIKRSVCAQDPEAGQKSTNKMLGFNKELRVDY